MSHAHTRDFSFALGNFPYTLVFPYDVMRRIILSIYRIDTKYTIFLFDYFINELFNLFLAAQFQKTKIEPVEGR